MNENNEVRIKLVGSKPSIESLLEMFTSLFPLIVKSPIIPNRDDGIHTDSEGCHVFLTLNPNFVNPKILENIEVEGAEK